MRKKVTKHEENGNENIFEQWTEWNITEQWTTVKNLIFFFLRKKY